MLTEGLTSEASFDVRQHNGRWYVYLNGNLLYPCSFSSEWLALDCLAQTHPVDAYNLRLVFE